MAQESRTVDARHDPITAGFEIAPSGDGEKDKEAARRNHVFMVPRWPQDSPCTCAHDMCSGPYNMFKVLLILGGCELRV